MEQTKQTTPDRIATPVCQSCGASAVLCAKSSEPNVYLTTQQVKVYRYSEKARGMAYHHTETQVTCTHCRDYGHAPPIIEDKTPGVQSLW